MIVARGLAIAAISRVITTNVRVMIVPLDEWNYGHS
jgi:hypothetical protein